MRKYALIFSLLLIVLNTFKPVIASPGDITRVSLPSLGAQANGDSNYPAISVDGNTIAFESLASNLVAGDSNGVSDIFVHDRLTGFTSRVSVDSNGVQGNGHSEVASISADGRYVSFSSMASNLVAGDSNAQQDIFVHDRNNGITTRVSVASGGAQANGSSGNAVISGDGRYVAFESTATNLVVGDTNSLQDVFIFDRNSNTTTRVSVRPGGVQTNGISLSATLSYDGLVVAFSSIDTGLVPDDTNGVMDVFVNEWDKNEISRVSVASYGVEASNVSSGASLSADGNYVAFYSYANDLVAEDTNRGPDVFLHDRLENVTILFSVGSGGNQASGDSGDPAISPDGYFLAFDSNASNLVGGDSNGTSDVFLHTREIIETELASKTGTGASGNAGSYYAAISQFGNTVAFVSSATDLVAGDTNGYDDIFIYQRVLGSVSRISLPPVNAQGVADSVQPSISADARFVAFASFANNLVIGDSNGKTDIFVHDRQSALTSRVSIHTDGSQSNGDSYSPSISGDGRYVAFHSDASNLVAGDSNNQADIFVHDLQAGTTTRVSVDSNEMQANNSSYNASISSNGQFVAFESFATNLVAADTNGVVDVFVRDLVNGTTVRVSVDSNEAQSNGLSYRASISANGLFIVYESEASNLISADSNGFSDIFVRDLAAGMTSRVSVASSGEASNWHANNAGISGDGRFVVFSTAASNLVLNDSNGISDVFLHDRQTATTKKVPFSTLPGAMPSDARAPAISADGKVVAFSSVYLVFSNPDNYPSEFITVHHISSGRTHRIECSDLHNPCSLSVSGDGGFVAFQAAYPLLTEDTNSVSDIYLYENDLSNDVFLPMLLR